MHITINKVFSILFLIAMTLVLSLFLMLPSLADDKAPQSMTGAFSWTQFPWQSTLGKDHPLNGKIWSVRDKNYITPENLITKLKNKAYIGLGETHDNPDHHLLQAWIIEQIAKNGARKPDIVMEMIDSSQNETLQKYLSQKAPTVLGIRKTLNWDKSGWPDWSLYAPITQVSLAAKLNIRAGNPTKKLSKKIGRKGFTLLGETRETNLHLQRNLPPVLVEDLQNQIVTGHCNMMPRSATMPMVRIQRLRDAVMAENVLKSAPPHGAILIAGSGHVRLDRGVPWYIRQSGKKMVSVVMAEAQEDALENPLELISEAPKGYHIADYIWITPRTQREYPCLQFKKFMKRKHKPAPPK